MEVEALIYWRSTRKLAALKMLPSLTPALLAACGEAVEELEAVAMHSEWPGLRAAAARALAGGTAARVAS